MYATETYYQRRIAELEAALEDQRAEFARWSNDAISDKRETEVRDDERKAAAERVRAVLDALVDDESPRFGCGCVPCTAERTALINAAGGEG